MSLTILGLGLRGTFGRFRGFVEVLADVTGSAGSGGLLQTRLAVGATASSSSRLRLRAGLCDMLYEGSMAQESVWLGTKVSLHPFSTSPRHRPQARIGTDDDEHRSRAKYSNMEDQKAHQEPGFGQRVRICSLPLTLQAHERRLIGGILVAALERL